MNYTDYLFVPAFLLMTLIYFHVSFSKQWIVLLITSLLFYASWGFWGFPYLIGAVVVSYAISMTLERQQAKGASKKKLRTILWTGVLLLIGGLAMVKMRSAMPESFITKILPEGMYRSILYRLANVWFPEGSVWQRFFSTFAEIFPASEEGSVTAALGISYFTLSLTGYMADVYWKKGEAERNPFKLLLFAAYFPRIVEGPISKHRSFSKQLFEGHRFDYDEFCFGMQRMLWGYFKKLVIADRLALFTNTVFGEYENYHGCILLVAAVFAAVQLYCDFSGCMDIALGLSQSLGIAMEENFNRPFFSQTAAEFWRRWHMSLGTWFKDYIYMPLVVSPKLIKLSSRVRNLFGGNIKVDKTAVLDVQEQQKKKSKRGKRTGKAVLTIIPTATVWILTGVWHGTGWNYLLWGVYWGLLIILSAVLEPEIKVFTAFLHINTKCTAWIVFRRLRTFGLFVISRILSMPSTLEASAVIFYRILRAFALWELIDGTLLNIGLDSVNFILVLLMIAVLMLVESRQEKGTVYREKIAAYPLIVRWGIYLGAFLFVCIVGVYGGEYDAASFVYMNF